MKRLRVFTNGGILSPVDLRKLVSTARSYACGPFQFTDRNEILVDAPDTDARTLLSLLQRNQFHCDDLSSPRYCIVSSYQANGILKTTSWLTDDVYLDVIGSLSEFRSLKINIVDPLQALVPLFTGELNFLASHHKNFWYLFVHLPSFEHGTFWPALIYSDDIAPVVTNIETLMHSISPKDIDELFECIDSDAFRNSRAVDKKLTIESRFVPTFEGWHSGAGYSWLGIYSKTYHYALDFLEDLCDLCVDKDIAKIHITSWRSLLVKGLKEGDRVAWETLLGKHNINTRHANIELFWQLPEVNADMLSLKAEIVSGFCEIDANTFGLYLGIANSDRPTYANIIIRTQTSNLYAVCHSHDFSPNNPEWIVFRQHVSLPNLFTALEELSSVYHAHKEQTAPAREKTQLFSGSRDVERYQCSTCLTIYNERIGDVVNAISPGTSFHDLPPTYCCPVCDEDISAYCLVENVSAL